MLRQGRDRLSPYLSPVPHSFDLEFVAKSLSKTTSSFANQFTSQKMAAEPLSQINLDSTASCDPLTNEVWDELITYLSACIGAAMSNANDDWHPLNAYGRKLRVLTEDARQTSDDKQCHWCSHPSTEAPRLAQTVTHQNWTEVARMVMEIVDVMFGEVEGSCNDDPWVDEKMTRLKRLSHYALGLYDCPCY